MIWDVVKQPKLIHETDELWYRFYRSHQSFHLTETRVFVVPSNILSITTDEQNEKVKVIWLLKQNSRTIQIYKGSLQKYKSQGKEDWKCLDLILTRDMAKMVLIWFDHLGRGEGLNRTWIRDIPSYKDQKRHAYPFAQLWEISEVMN